jgi:hypothetical protein
MKVIGMLLAVALLVCGASALAGTIQLPNDGDDYSKLVARAEAHDATTDFHALRLAYLTSKAFERAGSQFDAFEKLRKEMMDAAAAKDSPTVRAKAEALLSIDYTDLWAQKFLRQSCKFLQDEACADLHNFVEFGLLDSITHSGDGRSCATGWEAFQVKEEYFVLAMMGMRPDRQSLIRDGGHVCDAMDVVDDKGASARYYFRIDEMMAAEERSLKLK